MKHFLVLLSLSALVLFSGCALFNQMGSSSDEQLLSAAGFQARPVLTTNQKAVFQNLKPYQINTRTKGNTVYYIYPDPKQGIVFVGGPAQYQKYSQLAVQQGTAEDQMAAAAETQMLSYDELGMWDPFW
jgi:hypothetical protein